MKKIVLSGIYASLAAVACVACGDGDHLPSSVAGGSKGGVSGGPLLDTLTVYAVDADTAQPIGGATVFLGAGKQAASVGHTLNDGKLSRSGLGGEPQTVTVSAPGYAAASWGLITSAVAVIPLESLRAEPGNASVTVSLAGWEDLPPLAAGSYRIARFAYSRPNSLDALEAALETDAALGCAQAAGDAASSCSVTLSVPANATTLLAEVAEASDAGTPDDTSDDELIMTGLGLTTELALRPSAKHSLTLPLFDPSLTARATLHAAGATPGVFEEVVGVPGITLNGQILLYPSLGGKGTSFLVPTAIGAFENARLWAVATADTGTAADDWSRSYERGIAPPADAEQVMTLSTTEFLALPSISEQSPATYLIGNPGKTQRLEFSTPSGQELNVLLFPAQSQFELPSGVLPEHPNAVSVEAFDLELDAKAFSFQDLARQSTRIAYAHSEQQQ